MLFAAVIGVLSSIVVLIVMARIGIRKFMGYPATLDATVTVLLAWLLHGTYVGMVAAIIGGLFFSLIITVIRYVLGYSKLERRGTRLVWINYQPQFNAMETIERTTVCLKPLLTTWWMAFGLGVFTLACLL